VEEGMNRRKFLGGAVCGTVLLPYAANAAVEGGTADPNLTNSTALLTAVRKVCQRLAGHGWRELLLKHGLNITAPDLGAELSKTLPRINRRIKGFEDFALEGARGIEPTSPARSLLYHALASPRVIEGAGGAALTAFPTPAEIESVENYVFGIKPPSLEELRARHPGAPMVIAVFATEYRPAQDTVHGHHADLCFSRTGVSRVGTVPALYDGRARGFLPFVEEDVFGIRVLPARFAPYIAVELSGDKASFGPLRPHEPRGERKGDESNKFWVPVHKLFDGPECLSGFDLHVFLNAHHMNDKVRRVHENSAVIDKWADFQTHQEHPFTVTEGLATCSADPDHGCGLLSPVPHARLVEPAVYTGSARPDLRGQTITFVVPEGMVNSSGSAGRSSGKSENQLSPEFVHIRSQLIESGVTGNPPEQVDLNGKPDMLDLLAKGNYNAVIYLDHTADGWVSARCSELAHEVPWQVSAYSIIAPPDFYPKVGQRALLESIQGSVPTSQQRGLWNIAPPDALSDQRYAPNLALRGSGFDKSDITVTAIISLPRAGAAKQTSYARAEVSRRSHLPDESAAIFEPGADVGVFQSEGTFNLAAYKLSSPFPEDTKICAAVSAYWPAAIPDAARSFDQGGNIVGTSIPHNPWTAVPLTDQELGQDGGVPWDGIGGPTVVVHEGKEYAEYLRDEYADYVLNTIANKFTLALVGRVGLNEYRDRLFSMARVYNVLDVADSKDYYSLLSFRRASRGDAQVREAEQKTGRQLDERIYLYKFEVYHPKSRHPHPDPAEFKKSWLEISERTVLLVDPAVVLYNAGRGWVVGVE
jgi:hypothetical protein